MSSSLTATLPKRSQHGLLQTGFRLGTAAAGLVLAAWGCVSPAFRDAEGLLKGTFCLPLSGAVALLILAVAAFRPWASFGRWLALGVIGQAAALQLIDAGRRLHYQHYRPLDELLTPPHSFPFIIVAIQTAFVGVAVWGRAGAIIGWLRRHFRIWQLAVMAALVWIHAATVSQNVSFYVWELAFAAFIQTVSLTTLVLAAGALPGAARLSLQKRAERFLSGDTGRFSVLAAVWVAVVAGLFSVCVYERHPHIADEVVYLYQARYLAEGRLTMPAPPVAAAFNVDLMTYEPGRWYCPLPPGWPAVLAVGVALGAPWLVNPILAGINILLAGALLRRLYSSATAKVCLLLLSVSPWYLLMGSNYMTHTLSTTCALIAALGVVISRQNGKGIWGLAAGAAVGMSSLIRPLDGLIVAAIVGLSAVGIGGRRLKRSALALLVTGTALIGGLALPYNYMLTGAFGRSPLMAYFDKYYGPGRNDLGFGPNRGLGWQLDPNPGHSPLDAVINGNLNATSVNTELFGWSTGSLLLIAVLLFSGALRKHDVGPLAIILLVVAAYSLYWFSGGPDFGARYWFLIIIPSVVLSAQGFLWLWNKLQGYAAAALVGVIIMSMVNFLPWRAFDKYAHYLQMRPDVRRISAEHQFGKSLILVRGERFPDYASAAIYNPIDLAAAVPIYVWDQNRDVRGQALQAYPDRPVWILEGPTMTGAGFRIAAGPIMDRSELR